MAVTGKVAEKKPEPSKIDEKKVNFTQYLQLSSTQVYLLLVTLVIAIVLAYALQNKDDRRVSTINFPKNHLETSNWLTDDEWAVTSGESVQSCDFPEISLEEYLENQDKYSKNAFLLKGAALSWASREHWKRHRLLNRYGSRAIQSGSESSIVYGGGSAGLTLRLDDIIGRIRNTSLQDTTNLFTFDVSILKAIPELRNDFEVLNIFDWDNLEREKTGYMWHMLSLGPSRAGLPFHIHGETWIAVIHGRKRWFVYPPGISPPRELERQFNPLQSVWDWYNSIYPSLTTYPKPSMNTQYSQSAEEVGYRPLECIQDTGDIVFLPVGWSHLTINIGETIGIGGQAALPAVERYDFARDVLSRSPMSFESSKAASISLAHFAIDEMTRVQEKMVSTRYRLVQIRPDNFANIVQETHDTWVVIYAALGNSEETKYVMDLSNGLAAKFHGVLNVGLADVGQSPELFKSHSLTKTCHQRFTPEDEGESADSYLPCIIIYPGAPSFSSCHGKVAVATGNQNRGNVFRSAISYKGPVVLAKVAAFVSETIEECQLSEGSALTVTVHARQWLNESLTNVRRALEVQPYNSEARGLVVEILGHLGKVDEMKDEISTTVALFDELVNRLQVEGRHLSTLSIAAIYQKLGHAYLTVSGNLAKESIALLSKALEIHPSFSPALVSLAVAFNMLGELTSADSVIEELERVEPHNKAAQELRSLMKKNAASGTRSS